MHPILREIFMEPVGWMTIIGGLVIIGLPLVLGMFLRRKMREEQDGKPKK